MSTAAQRPAIPSKIEIVKIRRLSSLRVGVINLLNIIPPKKPITRAIKLYSKGINISAAEKVPLWFMFIIAIAILKTIKHMASSKATTCKRVFTKLPLAPYCLMVTMVLAGAVAVAEGKVQDASINSLLLDTDSLMLVVPVDHALAKKRMVTISELKKQPLILRSPSSGTRNLFSAHLESKNISLEELNVILEVDNIATIKDLIRRNIGVSILSRSVCLDEIKKGKITVLPIENLSMIREINILYHNDFKHEDILQNIMQEYKKVIKFYTS